MARMRRRWGRPGASSSLLRCAAAASAAAGALATLRRPAAPLGAFAVRSGFAPPQKAGGRFAGAAADLRLRGRRTARRLFDTGSFFGVGVSEAVVVGLLGWFLLGPEELYKLAKQAGGWLGELRTFVGQAAQQYEKALDDESTRKAIDGIRETQKTVAEVAGSWRTVADTFRDPLNLSNSFVDALDRASDKAKEKEENATKESTKAEGTKEGAKAKAKADPKNSYPDLSADGDFEDLEETDAELQAKKLASQQAASDLWFSGKSDDKDAARPKLSDDELPRNPQNFLIRLDERLDELETMSIELQELRASIEQDRALLKEAIEERAKAAEAEEPAAKEPEAAAVDPKPEPVGAGEVAAPVSSK